MKRTLLKLTAVCLALTLLFSVTAFAAQEDFKPFENSAFFSFGGYDIHYRVFEAQGAEKGRILMIHGFLSNTITWEPMVDGLTAAGYTCVLADMPTFGYSTKESAQVSPIPREDLAVELMRSIAPLDTWILAGHSMGGGISMNIATAHPKYGACCCIARCPHPKYRLCSKELSPLKPSVRRWTRSPQWQRRAGCSGLSRWRSQPGISALRSITTLTR
jgi:pimeloyl-ACP methyl ester carboxylesterase